MEKRFQVMVGIPTMTNRITIQVAGLMDALRQASYDTESEFEFHFTIQHGKAPVDYARNVIVGDFLRSKCDKLWFIDEDMLPTHSVARLVHHDADIICARMHKFDHQNPDGGVTAGLGLCAMKEKTNGYFEPLVPRPGQEAVLDCDAVGTACTVIRRTVLEDRRLWLENTYTAVGGGTVDGNVDTGTGEFAPALFRMLRAPSGMPIMGEDVEFCKRAKALGYSIKVDMNAECGHYKSIDIDHAGYLAQEVLKRAVRGVKLDDGTVMKYTVEKLSDAKGINQPPVHRMMTPGMAERRVY